MIKITDRYYLDSDSLQYILVERKVVNKEKSKNYGKETFKNIAYFPTIESLKNYIIEKEIKANIELLNNIDKVIELKNEIMILKNQQKK